MGVACSRSSWAKPIDEFVHTGLQRLIDRGVVGHVRLRFGQAIPSPLEDLEIHNREDGNSRGIILRFTHLAVIGRDRGRFSSFTFSSFVRMSMTHE